MILVKEVNMISMDGARARIVITSKIRTFADKDPESESRVNDTPPLPVTQSLAFGAIVRCSVGRRIDCTATGIPDADTDGKGCQD